jgi:hypothetical protein
MVDIAFADQRDHSELHRCAASYVVETERLVSDLLYSPFFLRTDVPVDPINLLVARHAFENDLCRFATPELPMVEPEAEHFLRRCNAQRVLKVISLQSPVKPLGQNVFRIRFEFE